MLKQLSTLTYSDISRGTGISIAYLSRMFTDKTEQRRSNPTLDTLLALQAFINERTTEFVSLDDLASAIR